ncbi:hypothetical protein [Methyloraptor flagellatus]|uniref:DUF1850 domain-containing protein n=1 Tax=Methyloraptor flagellatus TaxID=3162530 RepID=A0AAU7XJ41_9HYPH
MPICLATATKTVLVAAEVVTLAWTHSVERSNGARPGVSRPPALRRRPA